MTAVLTVVCDESRFGRGRLRVHEEPARRQASVAVALAGSAPVTSAEPPEVIGPFPVDQGLLGDLSQLIESRCGAEVTDVSGSGTTLCFKHVDNGANDDPTRGQGWSRLTIEVMTSTGATTVSELGIIGHLDANGVLRGRTVDICADLR